MTVRTALAAVVLGGLATLAGAVLAAILMAVILVASPDLARSQVFLQASSVISVLLQGGLGFLGTRFGSRPLREFDLREWPGPLPACCGPVLVGLPVQLGVAATGQRLVAALSVCALLAGAVLAAGGIRRRAELGARRAWGG